MVTVFEFFGNEPIENVITCMNYTIDRVIFLGYAEKMEDRKKSTSHFLKKYCAVKEIIFYPLENDDLRNIKETMRKLIESEQLAGNDIYFDITGGESLILLAFGMLSVEYDTPMHFFKVEENKIIELDEGATKSISTSVLNNPIDLDLDKYVELKGGIINNELHKPIKTIDDAELIDDLDKLWNVEKKYWDLWNPFSTFLKKEMISDEKLMVCRSASSIINSLRRTGTRLDTPKELNMILDDLQKAGLIKELKHADGKYKFRFKNETIKELLCDGGSVLELHTYENEKDNYDDCRVGIHLDWDGVISTPTEGDVLNEIDVLALNGNVPVFISCKSGKMGAHQILHAIYELEAVADRFGGKYAKKMLVTLNPIGNVYLERAKEMGIEVRCCTDNV